MSRRGFLLGLGAAGALAAGGGALAAWDRNKPDAVTAPACVSDDLSATEKTIVFSNWPLYIDADEKKESRKPTLEAFTAKTGIAVTYQEDVNDNLEFFQKIEPALQSCQAPGRDVMVLTEWMAARLTRRAWLQTLDKSKMPNVEANLLPVLRNRTWDPKREHAVPWQSGLAGLAYNGKVAKEIRTVEELLTRPDLKGKVTLLSEMRDTMGLVMLSLGYNPSKFTELHFDDALEKLRQAVASGQVRGFTGNEYADDLAKGAIAACMAWSGDVVQLNFEDPKIKFVAPESGAMLFSDLMIVPNRATHRGNVEQLMNYYYDPAVAAEVAAYVNYICPVAGAHVEMEKIDPDLATNNLIFPEPEVLDAAGTFMALTDAQERKYDAKFRAVVEGS